MNPGLATIVCPKFWSPAWTTIHLSMTETYLFLPTTHSSYTTNCRLSVLLLEQPCRMPLIRQEQRDRHRNQTYRALLVFRFQFSVPSSSARQSLRQARRQPH